jgi:hypothetical protein
MRLTHLISGQVKGNYISIARYLAEIPTSHLPLTKKIYYSLKHDIYVYRDREQNIKYFIGELFKSDIWKSSSCLTGST